MKRPLALLVSLLALGSLQAPSSAAVPPAIGSHGTVGVWAEQYRYSGAIYFDFNGTFRVGTKTWSGYAHGGHATDHPAEMRIYGTSGDGTFDARSCVDGTDKSQGGRGVIVCAQVKINGRAPLPLVLYVNVKNPDDPYVGRTGIFKGP
jgi:hypothetical protein